jgi:hypothetical protein
LTYDSTFFKMQIIWTDPLTVTVRGPSDVYEARLTAPAGVTIPAGLYIGWLTVAQLNTSPIPGGDVLAPPVAAGSSLYTGEPSPSPTCWSYWLNACACIASQGQFAAQYSANISCAGGC